VSLVGVHAERCEVHMGLLWIKSLTMTAGTAARTGPTIGMSSKKKASTPITSA